MMLGSRRLVAVLAAAALAGGIGVGAATGSKRHHAPRVLLVAAAQYLQIDRAELVKALRSGQTLAQVAGARGKPVSGLEAALVSAAKAKLEAAMAAGKLTTAQEQAKLARVEKVVDRLVNSRLARRPAARARVLRAAAKYIGITPMALANELRGKSLAQVANVHGKTAAGLKDAVLKLFTARLDKAVAAGRITPADAQARLARISARLDVLVAKPR